MTSVWFEGVDQLNALAVDLHGAGIRAQAGAPVVVSKVAHEIEATGKELCPVDTGATRNSIYTSVEGANAAIGPTTSYAPYVEFGTSRMAPEAFMGPALDRHGHELVDGLSQLAGRAIG